MGLFLLFAGIIATCFAVSGIAYKVNGKGCGYMNYTSPDWKWATRSAYHGKDRH